MRFSFIVLTTALCAQSAFAGPMCNVKTLGLAQELAQLDGLRGDSTSGAYSSTSLYTATVDNSEQFAFLAADSNKSCTVENILVGIASSQNSKALSIAECNIKASQIAQKIAQSNGLGGNEVVSKFSTTNQFVVTVDDSETIEITLSSDGYCLLQKAALE